MGPRQLAFAVLVCGCAKPPEVRYVPLDGEARARVEAFYEDRKKEGHARDLEIAAALEASRDGLQLARAPCPLSAADLGVTAERRSNAWTSQALGLLALWNERGVFGAWESHVDNEIGFVRTHLDGTNPEGQWKFIEDQMKRRLELPEQPYFVIEERLAEAAPRATGEREFHGGALVARYMLWSHAEKKLLCGAMVEATSSEEVSVRTEFDFGSRRYRKATASDTEGAVKIDLSKNGLAMALQSLRALEPVPPRAMKRTPGRMK
jgi:hypothetical protein